MDKFGANVTSWPDFLDSIGDGELLKHLNKEHIISLDKDESNAMIASVIGVPTRSKRMKNKHVDRSKVISMKAVVDGPKVLPISKEMFGTQLDEKHGVFAFNRMFAYEVFVTMLGFYPRFALIDELGHKNKPCPTYERDHHEQALLALRLINEIFEYKYQKHEFEAVGSMLCCNTGIGSSTAVMWMLLAVHEKAYYMRHVVDHPGNLSEPEKEKITHVLSILCMIKYCVVCRDKKSSDKFKDRYKRWQSTLGIVQYPHIQVQITCISELLIANLDRDCVYIIDDGHKFDDKDYSNQKNLLQRLLSRKDVMVIGTGFRLTSNMMFDGAFRSVECITADCVKKTVASQYLPFNGHHNALKINPFNLNNGTLIERYMNGLFDLHMLMSD